MTLLARPLVALSLEPGVARAVKLSGRRVEAWQTAPLPPGLLQGDSLQDPEVLAQALRGLFSAGGLPRSPLVVGLPALGAVARVLRLPEAPEAFLEEAVRWAARRELPVSPEKLHLTWRLVGREPGALLVLVIALPKPLVDGVGHALRLANLRPRALDLNVLALARLAPSRELVAVLAERSSASFLVVRNGYPELLRALAAVDLSRIPEEQDRLKEEVVRTLQFERSLGPGAMPLLLLSGSPELRQALAPLLPDSQSEPAGWEGFTAPGEFPRSEFMVNLGLALPWGGRPPAAALPRVNLLARQRRRGLSPKQRLALTAAALVVALLVPLHRVQTQARLQADLAERQLAALTAVSALRRAERQSTQRLSEELKTLDDRLAELGRQQAALREIAPPHAHQLTVALRSLVADEQLEMLAAGRGTLSLTVRAPSLDRALLYRDRLQASGAFARVAISEVAIPAGPGPVLVTLEARAR